MLDTKSNLSLFNFQGHNIRSIIRNGEPWFVARDVCEALDIANSWDAVSRLPEHQKAPLGISEGVATLPANTTIISEAALYKLTFRSNKEMAEVFTDWVASVVLPTIRKTGRYSLLQEEPLEPRLQHLQEVGLQTYLLSLSKDELNDELHFLRTMLAAAEIAYNYKHTHLPLSKEASRRELHYLRIMLAAVETVYNYKYPQTHDNKYAQEEHGPHQVETLVLPPVETKPDLQAILLDYLAKAGPVSVRYLQQSGPRCFRNLSADQLRTMLQTLVEDGKVKIVPVGKTESYQLV